MKNSIFPSKLTKKTSWQYFVFVFFPQNYRHPSLFAMPVTGKLHSWPLCVISRQRYHIMDVNMKLPWAVKEPTVKRLLKETHDILITEWKCQGKLSNDPANWWKVSGDTGGWTNEIREIKFKEGDNGSLITQIWADSHRLKCLEKHSRRHQRWPQK